MLEYYADIFPKGDNNDQVSILKIGSFWFFLNFFFFTRRYRRGKKYSALSKLKSERLK